MHFGSQRGREGEGEVSRIGGVIYAEFGRDCAVRVHNWFA